MALYPWFARDLSLRPMPDTMRHMISLGDDVFKLLDEPSRAFMRESHAMANTAVDVKETPMSYQFVADLPGLGRDEIKVQLENGNTLVISGERHRETKTGEPGDKYHRIERSTGKFMRRFTLPENAEVDKIGAQCKDGVLTVTGGDEGAVFVAAAWRRREYIRRCSRAECFLGELPQADEGGIVVAEGGLIRRSSGEMKGGIFVAAGGERDEGSGD
ncbi:hypothetical protein CBR_g48466 [Chara braunii]|uniref:SHSP domain-containing protein n=1 Tax=Chara braunii TaxID=69332 RepID=A0A388M2R6_CHABU|nr:hypothetical protein CBR_g48466 [Chara braunii]|eukprot:GBG88854.1 hypothetical protein CBR_g48466 [Chara braunii]